MWCKNVYLVYIQQKLQGVLNEDSFVIYLSSERGKCRFLDLVLRIKSADYCQHLYTVHGEIFVLVLSFDNRPFPFQDTVGQR